MGRFVERKIKAGAVCRLTLGIYRRPHGPERNREEHRLFTARAVRGPHSVTDRSAIVLTSRASTRPTPTGVDAMSAALGHGQ